MNWDAPLNLQPCCLNLRHKMMYCDPRQAVPGTVHEGSETRIYLCAKTQEVLGPDDHPVHPRRCGTGRACFSPPAMPSINGRAAGGVA